MQDRHLCWPPLLFPWPRSAPSPLFNSRIATGLVSFSALEKHLKIVGIRLSRIQLGYFNTLANDVTCFWVTK